MSLLNINTEVKHFCQVSSTTQDAVFQLITDGVEEWVQQELGVSLKDAPIEDTVQKIKSDGKRFLFVRDAPVTEVSLIESLPSEDDIDADIYDFRNNYIFRNDNAPWCAGIQRYQVTYKGGYDASTVPRGLKLAMLQVISRFYHNRPVTKSQTGAGTTWNFDEIKKSDLWPILKSYKMGVSFG